MPLRPRKADDPHGRDDDDFEPAGHTGAARLRGAQ